jgi:type IV secretory pathway TraG/TraD family ATPase VirD4
MAGYGIRSFLIAQSLNQIDKAYGRTIRSWTTAMSA